MRTDQYDRLKQLSERLTDVVLTEGATITLVEPTVAAQKKNDTYLTAERKLHWRKKNTMATLGILMRIHSLVGFMERAGAKQPKQPDAPGDTTQERDVDALIDSADREVEQILKGLSKRRDE